MRWSRKHTLGAGAALILAVNVVALSGVAYNRSGEPDSLLRLTERELHKPYDGWGFARESSGLSLKLEWRVRTSDAQRDYYSVGRYGEPAWLDRTKLQELGADVSRPLDTPSGKRHYQRLSSLEAFLVLELDGDAYRALSIRRAAGRSATRPTPRPSRATRRRGPGRKARRSSLKPKKPRPAGYSSSTQDATRRRCGRNMRTAPATQLSTAASSRFY